LNKVLFITTTWWTILKKNNATWRTIWIVPWWCIYFF